MAVLGDLEQHVMAVLWRARSPLSVRDVHERLHYAKPVAYTTVMTVLDRLAKKDAVERVRDGKAWIYRATKTCVDLHVEEILAMLSGCGAGHADQIIARVSAELDSVVQAGQRSCLTTGDPAWTPPGAAEVEPVLSPAASNSSTERMSPAAAEAPAVVDPPARRTARRPVPLAGVGCSFAAACRAADLDCSDCPSKARQAS